MKGREKGLWPLFDAGTGRHQPVCKDAADAALSRRVHKTPREAGVYRSQMQAGIFNEFRTVVVHFPGGVWLHEFGRVEIHVLNRPQLQSAVGVHDGFKHVVLAAICLLFAILDGLIPCDEPGGIHLPLKTSASTGSTRDGSSRT